MVVGRPLPLVCGGCPTTRDPGQDLQSLPLLVTMHMVLYMERSSWFVCHVMPVLRMQSKGAAEGEVSRESEASRNGCLACQSEFAF